MAGTLEAAREAPGDARILERLRGCLQFAVRTLESSDRSHPLWDVQLGEVSGYDKLVLEAGLLALLVRRSGKCRDEVHALASTVRRSYDAGTVLTALRRQPVLVTTLGMVLIVLDQFGLTTEEERASLGIALSHPYAESSERVPFRLLDRRWALHLAGRASLLDRHALAASAACRAMHPIYMSREDAYAITHAVMYATDFGASPPPAELAGTGLAETIDACLAWCLCERDYDLVAELLLAQVLLTGTFSPYGELAWRDCLAIWDDFGFLPSPSLSVRSFTAIADDQERSQYAYHHMYHTVFVAGLLCNALASTRPQDGALAPSAAPAWPQAARERDDVRAAVAAAHGLLTRTYDLAPEAAGELIHAVRWQADDSRISELADRWSRGPASHQAVARMAVDATIIDSARNYELAGLAAALRRAASEGWLSPTVMAGAGFLARQLLPAGVPVNLAPGAVPLTGTGGVSAALAGCLAAVERCWAARQIG